MRMWVLALAIGAGLAAGAAAEEAFFIAYEDYGLARHDASAACGEAWPAAPSARFDCESEETKATAAVVRLYNQITATGELPGLTETAADTIVRACAARWFADAGPETYRRVAACMRFEYAAYDTAVRLLEINPDLSAFLQACLKAPAPAHRTYRHARACIVD